MISPALPEERWRKPGRTSADASSFISSETLSKVDWYSRRPPKAHVQYYSSDFEEDVGDDGKHASEADDEHEGGGNEFKEVLLERGGPKEGSGAANSVPGESLTDNQRLLFAPFPVSLVYEKASIAASKEAKKGDRPPLHTQVGAIPRSGNIVPHSGILLPHYMNKHHSGAHGIGTHSHSKGFASMKGFTLLPSQVVCKSLKGRRGLDGEIEPSSPKVTCLGRVKTKYKYQNEPGKLSGLHAAVSHGDKDKMQQHNKKDPNSGLESNHDRAEGPTGAVMGPSTPVKADTRKLSHWANKKDVKIMERTSESEAKMKRSMRKALMEAKYRIKFHKEKDQCLLRDAPMAFTSTEVESGIDLGRFPSAKGMQMRTLRREITNLSTDGDYDPCDSAFVPQVPPTNSLLLMRNSKSRAACAVLGSSRPGKSATSTRVFDEPEGMAMENEHDERRACLRGANIKGLFAVGMEGVDPMHGRQMDTLDYQLFHTTTESEIRLWQRRCIVRPADIDVGRPITNS